MASRRAASSDDNTGPLVGVFVVVVGGIIWVFSQVVQFLDSLPRMALWCIIVGVCALVIVVLVACDIRRKRALEQREHMLASAFLKVQATIEQHLPALVRRREQLVRKDAYGKELVDDWGNEVAYFINDQIRPVLMPDEFLALDAWLPAKTKVEDMNIGLMVIALVEAERQKNPAFLSFSDDMTPTEFETFCAEQLRHAGWVARVTMQSRDQGVDVVAEKSGVRIAIQCKLYSRPVGNKAVQEIAAAKTHEQADYGIVVSNNKYTKEAEQLASTNKILLLHYTDLCKLDDIIHLKTKTINIGLKTKIVNLRTKALDSIWYYADDAGQVGPLTIDELSQTLGTFSNQQDIFVWTNSYPECWYGSAKSFFKRNGAHSITAS